MKNKINKGLLLFTVTFLLISPVYSLASVQTWNLSTDFRLFPNQANPNPDSYGNANVWYFMGSSTLTHDPMTYTLLSEFLPDALFISGLQGWQGSIPSYSYRDKLPLTAINATGAFQQVQTISWPAGVVLVHPLPDQLVVVGWRSPITGSVKIIGGVTDLDASCGDGIDWSVDKGSMSLTHGIIPNGGSRDFQDGVNGNGLSNVSVNQGDFIYFIVGPNTPGNHSCDSTGLDVVISQTEITVPIDIKPGSYPNSINLGSAGVIPVAILSTDTFDATQVNPDSISLAGARVRMVGKSNKSLCHSKDVNGDGQLDLLCQVETAQLMIEPGDSTAVLIGITYDGTKIHGEDSINIVP